MELWRELIDLEHSNMTRSGEWLELVKRKAERLDAAKNVKRETGLEPQKPQSKRALHKAVQAEKKQRRAAKAERSKQRAEWRKTLPPEQAEAKINPLKAETKAARKNRRQGKGERKLNAANVAQVYEPAVTYCPEKTNPRSYAILSWRRERSIRGPFTKNRESISHD